MPTLMRFTICVVLLCSSYGLIAQSKFHFTSLVKTINNYKAGGTGLLLPNQPHAIR